MSVRQVGKGTNNEPKNFYGSSTDVKPILTEKDEDSTFYCIEDTKDVYVWHIDRWYLL